jgi:hypothetical protein
VAAVYCLGRPQRPPVHTTGGPRVLQSPLVGYAEARACRRAERSYMSDAWRAKLSVMLSRTCKRKGLGSWGGLSQLVCADVSVDLGWAVPDKMGFIWSLCFVQKGRRLFESPQQCALLLVAQAFCLCVSRCSRCCCGFQGFA